MINAHIIGWGKYLPGKIVTNVELAKTTDINPEIVSSRTGIEARHIADPKQASADMATRAARIALEMADVAPDEIGLIIAATSTPDYLFPATACLVQDAIGASRAAAFDLGAGCSGFLYALVTADRFIRSGAYRHALVIGVETTSRFNDWKNRNLSPFFGDGAGAVVLTGNEQPGGLLSFALSADGSGGDLLMLPRGGARAPFINAPETELQVGKMDGRGLYRYGLRAMVSLGREAVRKARLKIEDVDLFIPHQTNKMLVQQTSERLHIPENKVLVNMARYANISAACMPVSICDVIEAGRLKPGDRVLMTAFGAGLTSAAVVWQWTQLPKKPMSFSRRFWHALWDAQAAFRSRLFRLEHQLDSLTRVEDEEPEEKT
jgi:3-oxoacyl-[acyl-carrier-protein] synthase-3